MNVPKYVGERIKHFRTQKNITQQELGEYLNTTSQTISRYESGVLQTNHDVLFKLAEYFNVSINDFFPPINNASKELSKEQEQKLLKEVLKKKGFLNENEELSEENFNTLIEFAKANKQFIMKDSNKE